MDALIAALEDVKEALEEGANKSGDGADDEGTGKVSGRGKSAKAGGVPASGKKPRAVPDDNDGVDESDPDDTDVDPEPEDLPEPEEAPVKPKGKPAAKTAPAKKTAKKTVDLDAVRAALTSVMNNDDLGKPAVLKVLKKFGATKSTEVAEEDFETVIAACEKLLESVEV